MPVWDINIYYYISLQTLFSQPFVKIYHCLPNQNQLIDIWMRNNVAKNIFVHVFEFPTTSLWYNVRSHITSSKHDCSFLHSSKLFSRKYVLVYNPSTSLKVGKFRSFLMFCFACDGKGEKRQTSPHFRTIYLQPFLSPISALHTYCTHTLG